MKISLLMTIFAILFSHTVFSQNLESQLKERREAANEGRNVEAREDMREGVEKLRASGLHERALKMKGKHVPALVFKFEDGSVKNISEFYADGPIVLNFYRGGWCPYCMLELQSYQAMKDKFNAAGAQIIALAPDTYKEIAKTKRKFNLDYLVVSDTDNLMARRMGIAFKVDAKTLKHYKKFGIDLKASQGNDEEMLPMPGTYVIDKEGIIQYAYIDPDYTKRAEPGDVLSVVKKIGAKK